MNVFLIGIMGAGKTTVGKELGKEMNMDFIDVDRYVEKKSKTTVNEMFKNGEDYFRDKESEAIKELCNFDNKIISCGGGVIKREENIKSIRESGFVIYLDRPIDNILETINIEKRPLLKEGKEKLYAIYEERKDIYEKACHMHYKSDGNIRRTVRELIKVIESKINREKVEE